MRRTTVFVVMLFATALLLGSCAPNSPLVMSGGPGFWHGLWHGIIAPIAFVISWFSDTVGIYAVGNGGGWYDFGFLLGIGAWGGGGGGAACSSRKRKRDDDD